MTKIPEKQPHKLSTVFPWILLGFALITLYLVIQMGFKETKVITHQEIIKNSSSAAENAGRGLAKEVANRNLYKYFDIKKWP